MSLVDVNGVNYLVGFYDIRMSLVDVNGDKRDRQRLQEENNMDNVQYSRVFSKSAISSTAF